ncbi:hypothetical protein PG999_010309 [Apiospora kogelbergensis]|uniref:Uncharacterized protein n=1 Tax=Apiospora kogelbergensis TaxID=1337665 RepID=A0AAW0QBA8_9PEZI
MHSIDNSADLTWPASTIISLTILLVTIVLAPLGWLVQRHWGREPPRDSPSDNEVELEGGHASREAETTQYDSGVELEDDHTGSEV